ncbi:MarR family winged helix-turn-helix transcriptional regulator [Lacticaseibacillus porcinae]|uniref:MarR family winged helix-turn-helix transcriptional regulator n=1 Tax=Lacticaseibacillus porcinae TaxID=1123687 RepID=UPI000F78398E|nr:MarR family transcriptional regulator [Lacticaseibacillus porcinae]
MLDIIRDIGAITRTIQIRSNAEFRPLELDNNRFIYLIRVCEQPGMFLGALADSMQIDRTTAFRTVKKLVADGWLRLEADPADKRLRCVFPTERALTLYPRLHAFEQAQSDHLLAQLSDSELKRLRALMGKLQA